MKIFWTFALATCILGACNNPPATNNTTTTTTPSTNPNAFWAAIQALPNATSLADLITSKAPTKNICQGQPENLTFPEDLIGQNQCSDIAKFEKDNYVLFTIGVENNAASTTYLVATNTKGSIQSLLAITGSYSQFFGAASKNPKDQKQVETSISTTIDAQNSITITETTTEEPLNGGKKKTTTTFKKYQFNPNTQQFDELQ